MISVPDDLTDFPFMGLFRGPDEDLQQVLVWLDHHCVRPRLILNDERLLGVLFAGAHDFNAAMRHFRGARAVPTFGRVVDAFFASLDD